MTEKLHRILIIDDNPADVFLHTRVIKRMGCAEEIDACEDGLAALEYLRGEAGGEPPRPALVFLDINMPCMNGWEFLEAYEALPAHLRGGVVIAMLTGSQDPVEALEARKHEAVQAYMAKPLSPALLTEILAKHYPDALPQP